MPRIAIINTNSENSAYTNYSTFNRNCYLVSGTHYCEDVYYAQYCAGLTSCMDCFDVDKSELCYECFFCEKCYNCNFCAYLVGCFNCDFSYDLSNCQNCFLCSCIQNQEFCILNEKLTKEEYDQKKKFLLKNHSADELWKMLADLRQKIPQRAFFQKNCENCVGSDLRNSKNLFLCFNAKNAEDVSYGGTNINNVKTSVDIDNCASNMSEELYNSVGVTGGYSYVCCNVCWFSQNLYYCEHVFNSHDCFGCVGRNHAGYEILNKKYSKEEYAKRIEEIKNELKSDGMWGEMFIPATYPYADTIAALYYAN